MAVFLIYCSASSYGQSMYFKLKDTEQKPQIVNQEAVFNQSEITSLLAGFVECIAWRYSRIPLTTKYGTLPTWGKSAYYITHSR